MLLQDIYATHHAEKGRFGFSILEQERSDWFLAQHPPRGAWLDLGCRDATLTCHFVNEADSITGIDIDPSALERARILMPHATFHQMDLLGPWNEVSGRLFDVIICSEALEHVYFPKQVVMSVASHLKPGGLFLGSVPNAFFVKHRMRYLFGRRRWTPLDDPTHITQFNESLLRDTLSPVGEEILIQGYTAPPFHGLAKTMPGLFAFDFLFCVRKRSDGTAASILSET